MLSQYVDYFGLIDLNRLAGVPIMTPHLQYCIAPLLGADCIKHSMNKHLDFHVGIYLKTEAVLLIGPKLWLCRGPRAGVLSRYPRSRIPGQGRLRPSRGPDGDGYQQSAPAPGQQLQLQDNNFSTRTSGLTRAIW